MLGIKNLTAIAHVLASVEETQVTFKHLAKATRVNDKFVGALLGIVSAPILHIFVFGPA
ncbi:hypothetical protein FE257_005842 [Aspergillus nanangensis]|uniref:Uncharacterized protein n=1 Tax=Aspergillus nanangensis TaxID=2582783 RepID=A0AAD4CQ74_ASPNN|nr:hypothetical protein FE257_005842 [Aspergillus nanangensis]